MSVQIYPADPNLAHNTAFYIAHGNTIQFQIQGWYSNRTAQTISASSGKWSSTNASIATVDTNGVATSVGPFVLTTTGAGEITQAGNSVSGSLALSGTPCASSGALTGTVNGTSLTLGINENGQVVTLTGAANSGFKQASGTYIAPAGGCTNGDSGTWTTTKG